jgi:hypothetical protein
MKQRYNPKKVVKVSVYHKGVEYQYKYKKWYRLPDGMIFADLEAVRQQ